MGNPDFYYKRSLQVLARYLVFMDDKKFAEELLNEQSVEMLEKFILQKKEEMEEKNFYYAAGQTCHFVLLEANEDGCDAFNASIGGLVSFEYFIGLQTDEENDA